jgi:hypothetical protein
VLAGAGWCWLVLAGAGLCWLVLAGAGSCNVLNFHLLSFKIIVCFHEKIKMNQNILLLFDKCVI